MKVFSSRVSIFMVASSFILTACGGSGGGVGSLNSLSDLPSASEMVATSESSSSVLFRPVTSGTPPLLSELVATSSLAVSSFWGESLIADLANPANVNSSTVRRYFGEAANQEGGEGACRMTENVARSFETLLQAGGSLCYMKNMPGAIETSDVSPTFDGNVTEVFDQSASDRVVQVTTLNDSEEAGSEKIFIKVYGSNNENVGSSNYKVDLWFCNPDTDVLRGYEQITVNKSTGLITQTSRHNDDNGGNLVTIEGYLKKSGSSFTYDSTKARTALVNHSYNDSFGSGVFKGLVQMTSGNQIITKQYSKNTFDPGDGSRTWKDQLYAIGNFTGSGVKNVRFTEGGFSGESVELDGVGDPVFTPHTYKGGTEFQSGSVNMYFATPDSDLAQTAEDSADFSGDSFYTQDLSPTTFDTSAYDCTVTPEYTIQMDFAREAIIAVRELCDGDRLSDSGNGSFCEPEAVRTARENIYSSF